MGLLNLNHKLIYIRPTIGPIHLPLIKDLPDIPSVESWKPLDLTPPLTLCAEFLQIEGYKKLEPLESIQPLFTDPRDREI